VKPLYPDHVATRRAQAAEALEASGFDAVVLSSGHAFRYFADDMDAPHHPNAHFASWVPLEGPHHLLLVRPGQRPKLVRHAPEDFWYEQTPVGAPFWLSEFDYEEVASNDEAWKAVACVGRVAYLGDAPDEAKQRGL
jgi:Xaa-Pro dipeptidase